MPAAAGRHVPQALRYDCQTPPITYAVCSDERNQLLHRIQIIAAERYDSLARAYFQRQWQLAQLQAMHDYQERAADVRFIVSMPIYCCVLVSSVCNCGSLLSSHFPQLLAAYARQPLFCRRPLKRLLMSGNQPLQTIDTPAVIPLAVAVRRLEGEPRLLPALQQQLVLQQTTRPHDGHMPSRVPWTSRYPLLKSYLI